MSLEEFDDYQKDDLKKDLIDCGMKLGPVNKLVKFYELRKASKFP